MNTVIACLLVLAIMPIACSWISGYYRSKLPGGVDNKHPRQQAAQLEGAGARAIAAQANSWEALAVFTAALVAVALSGMDVASVATLSLSVVVLRLVFVAAYLANIDILRSLCFLGSFGVCMYIFYLALCGS